MASIDEMLRIGGSFEKAEAMALQAVGNGKPEFWLDLALLLSVQGKFTGARQAQTQYYNAFPKCSRGQFAMAPFALMDGELQTGLRLLERGREIKVWGGISFKNVMAPLLENQPIEGKTILIYGEGGLGDEVLNMRAASWIKEAGGKCIVACSRDLMKIASTTDASAVVDAEVTHAPHYDYWLPSMSAPRLFNRTWETLWPGQYIKPNGSLGNVWKKIISADKFKVGLRWQGNPQFEHEQLRRFDPKLLFNATEFDGVSRWSLQKDSPTDLPKDVTDLEPFLTTWEHTVAAIAQLDLVITSCTSIVHVAGAMGKPTWVVVPVMPYYPWAKAGVTTDWYPSVRVYRQEKYGEWDAPFQKIKTDLQRMIK